MSAFYDLASLVVVPSGYKASKVYAQKPLTTDGQLAFSRASTATRVNASGALETVSSNVPRLDYTNSTCPKLLLEKQSTNYLTYSNDFSNAAYNAKQGVTLTSGQADPFGGTSAWKLELAAGVSYLGQGGLTSALRTASIWMRADAATTIGFSFGNTTPGSANVTTTWQRFTFTANEVNGIQVDNYFGVSPINQPKTVYIYQGQVEDGSYATSIIPTTTAAVTRLKDSCLTASVTNLIGQTEGTFFIEMTRTNIFETFFVMLSAIAGTTANAYQNSIYLFQLSNGGFVADVWVGNASQVTSNTTALSVGTHKLAITYKQNDFAIYVDGVQRVVSTSGNVPAMNFLTIAGAVDGGPTSNIIKQTLLFKTRLTNAQLAELTTI